MLPRFSSEVEEALRSPMVWAFKDFLYARLSSFGSKTVCFSLLCAEAAAPPVNPITVGYLSVQIRQLCHNVRLSSHSFSAYLLSFSNKLGIVLGIRKEMVDQVAVMEFTLQWEKK